MRGLLWYLLHLEFTCAGDSAESAYRRQDPIGRSMARQWFCAHLHTGTEKTYLHPLGPL